MSLSNTDDSLDHLNEVERDCIETCYEAAEACETCADECLGS